MKYLIFSMSPNHWQKSVSLDFALNLIDDGHEIYWVDANIKGFNSWELPVSNMISRKVLKYKIKWLINRLNLNSFFHYIEANIPLLTRTYDSLAPAVFEEMVTILKDSSPCVLHSQDLSNYLNLKYYSVREFASKMISKMEPGKVVIFNGRFLMERAAWDACLELGTSLLFLERFSPQWTDRYFVFDAPVHSTEYRSALMLNFFSDAPLKYSEKQQVASDWFEKRRLGISQSFTRLQNQGFLNENLDSKIIGFFHSSEDELLAFNLEGAVWSNQFELIEELIEFTKVHPEYMLVVRIHPNLLNKSPREIEKWDNFAATHEGSNVIFINASSSINSYDVVAASDVVVTYGSTIGVEAAYLGKYSILCGKAFHEHMGILPIALRREEMYKLILENQDDIDLNSSWENALKYGFFHSNAGISFKSLEVTGDPNIQDPWFTKAGITLKPVRIGSLLRRIERKCYQQLQSHEAESCVHD